MPVLTTQDPFWDIRSREAAEERELKQQLEGIQRALQLGNRARALRGGEGFKEFVRAVEDLHDHALRRLARAELGNDALREVRGKVEALRDVLALLQDTDRSLEILAAREQGLQNQLSAVLRARPKPRSE